MGVRLRSRRQQGWVAAALTLLTLSPVLAQTTAATPYMIGPLFLQLAVLLLLIIVGLILLFIPAYIAFRRQHPNRWAIAVICLAFGGTIIGWFGALIWALQVVHQSQTGSHGGESGLNVFVNDTIQVRLEPDVGPAAIVGVDDVIERLAQLKRLSDLGAINAEEYATLRQSILTKVIRSGD